MNCEIEGILVANDPHSARVDFSRDVFRIIVNIIIGSRFLRNRKFRLDKFFFIVLVYLN